LHVQRPGDFQASQRRSQTNRQRREQVMIELNPLGADAIEDYPAAAIR
jgi:hypothetical protein